MYLKKIFFLFLLAAIVSCSANENTKRPYTFTDGDPADYGVSADSLQLLSHFLESAAEEKEIPGAVAMIVKDGAVVYRKAFGFGDIEQDQQMTPNHIFRIASMTKPITSTAILMLAERGELSVEDPVSMYIPEFSNPTVLEEVNFSDTTWTARPARREVTIHDLLTHTSGIAYGFIDSTMNAIYSKSEVSDGIGAANATISETMGRLGELPLKHEPGESWTYGLSTDVLGRVVEVASETPFDIFLKENIFDPLGMDDTGFYAAPDKRNRVAAVYRNPAPNELARITPLPESEEENSGMTGSETYFSGGAGLLSTADDYHRFLQAVLNGGMLGDTRIFGEEVTRLLTEHQMGNMMLGSDGFTYGFGLAVEGDHLENGRRAGRLSWGGIFQTYPWIDPDRNATVVLMTQVYPSAHQQELYNGFERLVNSSFVE